jgi:peptidyl-prolyl cis-trans isomerase C
MVRGRLNPLSTAAPVSATAAGSNSNCLEEAKPMPKTAPPHPPKIVSLSLVFLFAGMLGCSHGSQGEQPAAAAKPAAAAPAGSAAGATATGAAATAAAPGSSAGSAGSPGGAVTPGSAGSAAAPQAPGAGGAAAAVPGQAAAPQPLSPDKIPAVVAKVNGAPIQKGELLKTAEQVHSQMMPNAPETADFYRRVLDNLVARELLLQEAKASGVTASDDEVNKQLAELKGRFGSPEKFQEELKKEGMTEAELTQRARDAFVVQKLVESKVVNDVKVSDQEAKAFYDQNQKQMERPERVHARHILVSVPKGATAEQKQKARAKADDILAKVKAGGDFAKLAGESSDDPGSKQRGGDLGWFSHGQMVPAFDTATFALKKPNDLAPVVETDYGFHVIQLVEHQDAGVAPFAEVKDRITEFLKQKQQQEKVQDHIKALRAKGKVEVFI